MAKKKEQRAKTGASEDERRRTCSSGFHHVADNFFCLWPPLACLWALPCPPARFTMAAAAAVLQRGESAQQPSWQRSDGVAQSIVAVPEAKIRAV